MQEKEAQKAGRHRFWVVGGVQDQSGGRQRRCAVMALLFEALLSLINGLLWAGTAKHSTP